jgi:predicted nucleic acid-binding protein
MKVFIDTSSLLKKYVDEKGTEKFLTILEDVTDIIIAPITILEVHSAIERRLHEKTLKQADAKWIQKQFLFDYTFFGIVEWNDALQKECIRLLRRYQLKVLDSIQLSSAIIAEVKLFITSDKKLFNASKKEIAQTVLI